MRKFLTILFTLIVFISFRITVISAAAPAYEIVPITTETAEIPEPIGITSDETIAICQSIDMFDTYFSSWKYVNVIYAGTEGSYDRVYGYNHNWYYTNDSSYKTKAGIMSDIGAGAIWFVIVPGDPYPINKEITHCYTHTMENPADIDVTKVKVEWAVNDITVNVNSKRAWNPDALCWEEASVVVSIAENEYDAKFKITNLSSVKVKTEISFDPEENLITLYDVVSSSFINNSCIVGSVVKEDAERTVDTNLDHDEEIIVKLGLNKEQFKTFPVTSNDKFGTYTITLHAESIFSAEVS